MSTKRLKVVFGPGSRGDYEFTRRPPAPSSAPAPQAHAHAKARKRKGGGGSWLDTGIARFVLLALIVVCGVAAVVWIRDLGSAFGVHWLGDA